MDLILTPSPVKRSEELTQKCHFDCENRFDLEEEDEVEVTVDLNVFYDGLSNFTRKSESPWRMM
jgi:hypothetical protein